MEFEHCSLELPLDENLDGELKKKAAEGWGLVPGTKPVCIYQLVRVKKQHDIGGEVNMGVHDDKVHILRNGQIVG